MHSMFSRTYFQVSDAGAGGPAGRAPTRDAPQEALTVAREIAAFFIYLNKRYAREFYSAMGELGLSFTQFKALHLLDDRGEQSVKELAGDLSVSLPATSRAVEGLHQRGLVDRREDDEDRRMKRVALSGDGRATLEQLNQLRFGGLVDFVATLEDEDRDRLQAALEPIIDRDEVHACLPGKLRSDA